MDGVQNKKGNGHPQRICLGLAFSWVWGYLAFHTPILLNEQANNHDLNECYLLSLCGITVAMLLSTLLSKPVTALLDHRGFLWASAAITAGSSLVMRATLGGFIAHISALLSGLFSGCMTLAWGLFFGLADTSVARAAIPRAGVVMSLVVIVGHLLPHPFGLIIAATAPFLALSTLPRQSNRPSSSIRFLSIGEVFKPLRRYLCSVMAFGLALGAFRGTMPEGIGNNPQLGSILFFAGMGLVAGVYIVCDVLAPSRLSVGSIYKVALPITVAGLLLPLSTGTLIPYVSAVLLGGGFICFDLAVWIMSENISHTTRISPVSVFGFTKLASHLGMLLGSVVGTNIELGHLDRPLAVALIVTILVGAVMVTLGKMRIITVRDASHAKKGTAPSSESSSEATLLGIQMRFGLTEREAQILPYLLSGATREHIQNELVLSESTVKTHVRHIYEKTGVHSKQELMDLIREISR